MMEHRQLSSRYLFLAIFILSVPCLILLEDRNLFLFYDRFSTISFTTTTTTTTTTNTTTNQRPGVVPSSSSSSKSLLSEHDNGWWKEYVPSISRVYTPWNGTTPYGWCFPSKATRNSKKKKSDPLINNDPISGLIYVKSPKTSSSTCQGVTINIAHHIGRLMTPSSSLSSSSSSSSTEEEVLPCTYYSRHGFAESKGHGRPRQHNSSLLWSLVRHPAARDLSGVMYVRVRNGMEPTDENILRALSEERFQGAQVRYLLPSKQTEKFVAPHRVRNHPEKVAEIIETQILKHYDFIGVTERMDDSLAVMTLLWQLDPTDVIVLSSKQAGGYAPLGNTGFTPNGTKTNIPPPGGSGCVKLQKAHRTRAVEDFLHSDTYQSGNADFLLYDAVVTSLDRTINELGRDVVQDRVNHIRELQQLAELQCSQVAHFPCSSDNAGQTPDHKLTYQSCYVEDAGCGHQCVDEALLTNRTILY